MRMDILYYKKIMAPPEWQKQPALFTPPKALPSDVYFRAQATRKLPCSAKGAVTH